MLDFYKKKFQEKIKLNQIKIINGNAENINKYTNENFDIAFICSALWDLEIEKTLKNLSKVLNKNGLIIFNLPALVVEKEKGFIYCNKFF